MSAIVHYSILGAGILGALLAFFVARRTYAYLTSSLRHLPGPPFESLLWGHMNKIQGGDPSAAPVEIFRQYGTTFTLSGIMGIRRFISSDPKAAAHILHNAYEYPKPEGMRYNLGRMVGPGVLVVEGHHHRMQRKVMSPAFAPSHIKELTTTFIDKSIQLRDLLNAECTKTSDGILHTDILAWVNRVTLDVIGLTGFNYDFNSLNPEGKPNELNDAFREMFSSTGKPGVFRIMQGMIPALRLIPTVEGEQWRKAQATMSRIGSNLLNESRDFLRASGEKSNWRSRDLLSLLLRANTSTDIPESQRMNDKDVIAQVPTFFVAGHETTASTIVWFLYSITEHVDIQRKLREEIMSVSTDAPTLDELNALPYLDAVLRETLRLHSPVNSTVRVASKDDIIPFSKPIIDKNGIARDSIKIKKGEIVVIPITRMNTDPALWGEDAEEFRPDRWQNLPESVKSIPGVWGNIMTFFGGARACIGYRFSLAESKAIMFTLVRAFEFELGTAHSNIGKKSMIVQRPFLKDNTQAGNLLPVIIKPIGLV